MPTTRIWSRRKLMQATAGSAVLLPFLRQLANDAHAAAQPPKRVIFVFGGICTVSESFYPKGSETDWGITPILTPLRDLKSQLVIPMGLKSHYGGPGSHTGGTHCFLTAANNDKGGMSIDQHLANELKGKTPLHSLYLGVNCTSTEGPHSRVSWRSASQATKIEQSPSGAYRTLFGSLVPPAKPIATSPSSPPMMLPSFDRSVLDFIKADIAELTPRLGIDGRQKLEQHLDGIRQTERLMGDPAAVLPSAESPGVTCTRPAAVSAGGFSGNDSFPAVGRMQMDLMVNALACDLTRVAVLQWTRGTNDTMFRWLADKNRSGAIDPDYAWLTNPKVLDGIGDFGHHIISHENGGDTRGMYGHIDDCRPKLTAISTWYAVQVAHLAKRLKSIPEGAGTMLDSTLIVWGCEIESGTGHNPSPKPYVLVGNLGGAFRTGRAINYRGTGGSSRQLYTSICDAMGVARMPFEGKADEPLRNLA